MAVDDFSCVAYAELLPDETAAMARALMGRCLGFFRGLGIGVEGVMADNGSAYRSSAFSEALGALGVRHVYARPYSPWQNGKVERMNRTLAQEWQYARAWDGEAGTTIGGVRTARGELPPMALIASVNNVMAQNS